MSRIATWRQQPQLLLLAMTFVVAITFAVWNALLNNFVIEEAAFGGAQIGMLQSLREVPGFLAFSVIFVLLLIKEQRLALVSLLLLSVGVGITGWFPFELGLYGTTVLMSIGFHYFETLNQSLTLQWLDKQSSGHFMGRQIAVRGAASLTAYGAIWVLMEWADISYNTMYMLAGGLGVLITLVLWGSFPQFSQPSTQHKQLVLRKRYWLYYGLTFFSGARRQIFVVFAAFMMVQKFHYSVGDISLLFMFNYVFNLLFAPAIGRWIGRIGERRALIIEYVGLLIIFSGYAVVQNAHIAAGLYILDHLLFAMAIAMKTYLQKIADPRDIASTSGVSFTINHIAAIVIPALLGLLWETSPAWVFYTGCGFALGSLLLAFNVPHHPEPGNEVLNNVGGWANQPIAESPETIAVKVS